MLQFEVPTMKIFKQFVASFLIASTTLAGLPMSAQAAMVTTEVALTQQTDSTQRERVSAFLARADVRQALEDHGVTSQSAVDRVHAMTDAEVAQLAGRIDQAPAGGDILGVLFTVFIVLLVTDILGLTKVFPFTRSVR
jgi:hypothetical protein